MSPSLAPIPSTHLLLGTSAPMQSESESSLLWECRHADLIAWKKTHGNCNVPKAEGKLGRWVVRQRELYKKGKLENDRKEQLDKLGFVWNTNEAAWEHRYALLLQYAQLNGHSCVPISDPTLGMWVAKMRANRRKNKLPLHRINKLDAIGFVWNTAEADWMDKFDKLLKFRTKEGHACVPFNEGEVGWWVNTQRQCKRKGKLSEERESLLNQAEFVWNPQEFLVERRRLTARTRSTEKRGAEEKGTPGRASKRRKPLSPSCEKPLFANIGSNVTSSAGKSYVDIAQIRDTPTSNFRRLGTPATEPSIAGSSSSRSERGEVHSCSIASLLSPCPSPVPENARLPIHRKLEFPEELSELPPFHGGRNTLHIIGLRRDVAPKFVLPPMSSLRDLGNGSRP